MDCHPAALPQTYSNSDRDLIAKHTRVGIDRSSTQQLHDTLGFCGKIRDQHKSNLHQPECVFVSLQNRNLASFQKGVSEFYQGWPVPNHFLAQQPDYQNQETPI